MADDPVVGILVDEYPLAHDAVRYPPRKLGDRIQAALARELGLGGRAPVVRGSVVAADSLIEALLAHPGARRYELFASPSAVPALTQHVAQWQAEGLLRPRCRIRSIIELGQRASGPALAALFSPSGHWARALRVRRDFAQRPCPVTAVAHGFGLHQMLYASFLNIALVRALECDSIVCSTRVSRQAFLNVFAHVTENFNREFGTRLAYQARVDVIPLCVNTHKLRPQEKAPLRKRLGLPKDAFVLLYAGRMSLPKGDWLPFVKMFAGLVRRNPRRKLVLVMCGTQEGKYADSLRGYARSLGIADKVRFEPDFPDEAKEHLIPAADVFVSVSDTVNEVFGLAPVEAMACGIPQVVSDWDGYRETVVQGETGFLVRTYWTGCDGDLTATGPLFGADYDHRCLGQSVATDMRGFAEFLECLITGGDLRARMGERSRARALELYSYAAVAKRYDELWTELEEIARNVALAPRAGNFEKPEYHKFFGHYASDRLDDGSPLRLAAQPGDAVAMIEALPDGPALGQSEIIDPGLAYAILSRAESLGGAGGPVTVGDLVRSSAAGNAAHPDRVLRHVMWLVKYGLLEPVRS